MRKVIFVLLIILISLNIFSQKKLLLLYKDSEQYGLNMIKNYIIPILERWEINYDLENVETYNLYNIAPNNYYGVISWYYSTNNIQNPKLYLRQISDLLSKGGFFFFFNNIGVSIDLKEINNVLNKIGIHYFGSFKELENFSIEYEDEYFVQKPTYQKIPVEKYISFGDDTKVLLTIYSNEIYPMIFLSKNGGAAIFNSFIDEKGNVILNIEKILYNLLNKKAGFENKILIVKNKYDENPYLNVLFHLQKIFDYSLLEYEIINQDDFYHLSYFDILPYKYIIWNSSTFFIENTSIKKYIENGGTLIFVTSVFNTPWANSEKNKTESFSKVIFSKKIFPLFNDSNNNFELNKYFNVNYEVNLENENIIAYFQNENGNTTPAIWFHKEKNGYIGYINPQVILKETRGLILQSILEMQDVSISGIINSFVFMLDDFPLPSYNIPRLKIDGKEITDSDFYYDIWWPAIKNFAEKYNLKLSTYVPFNYNASTEPPFEFSEFLINSKLTIKALKEIVESPNIELGLHGYNHISLTKENWENPNNIVKSIDTTKNFLEKILGHPISITSYVAPNNVIDEFGLNYLLQALPELKIIGTRYEGSEYFTEYRIIGNTILFPRSTYGYYPTKKKYFTTINTLANFGAFQHYIHPDDVFDKGRNPDNLSWNELYKLLETFYDSIKNKFPWLRNQSVSEAYRVYYDYFSTKVNYYQKDGKIYINLPDSTYFPRFFYIKSKVNINSIVGGKIVYKYVDNNIYIIQMDKPLLEITLGGFND